MIKFSDIKNREELLTRVGSYNNKPFLSTGNQYSKISKLLSKTKTETHTLAVTVEYTAPSGGKTTISRFI